MTMLDLRKYEIRTLLENEIVILSDVIDKRDVVIGLLGREEYAKVARMAESLR